MGASPAQQVAETVIMHGQGSYTAEHVRKKAQEHPQKLLTDRSAYIMYLECQLERVSAACLTVQSFDERLTEASQRMQLLEEKVMNSARLAKCVQEHVDEMDSRQQAQHAELRRRLSAVEDAVSAHLAHSDFQAQQQALQEATAVCRSLATRLASGPDVSLQPGPERSKDGNTRASGLITTADGDKPKVDDVRKAITGVLGTFSEIRASLRSLPGSSQLADAPQPSLSLSVGSQHVHDVAASRTSAQQLISQHAQPQQGWQHMRQDGFSQYRASTPEQPYLLGPNHPAGTHLQQDPWSSGGHQTGSAWGWPQAQEQIDSGGDPGSLAFDAQFRNAATGAVDDSEPRQWPQHMHQQAQRLQEPNLNCDIASNEPRAEPHVRQAWGRSCQQAGLQQEYRQADGAARSSSRISGRQTNVQHSGNTVRASVSQDHGRESAASNEHLAFCRQSSASKRHSSQLTGSNEDVAAESAPRNSATPDREPSAADPTEGEGRPISTADSRQIQWPAGSSPQRHDPERTDRAKRQQRLEQLYKELQFLDSEPSS